MSPACERLKDAADAADARDATDATDASLRFVAPPPAREERGLAMVGRLGGGKGGRKGAGRGLRGKGTWQEDGRAAWGERS
jgi:hypothetical protein